MKKLLATLTTLAILTLSLTACGPSEPEYAYEGPIEGWASIAMPENVTFERTVISGPVENHHYNVALTKEEVFTFIEMAMPANGWILDATSNSIRNYLSEGGDLVNYNVSESESSTSILVIIEPYGAYGIPDEEPAEDDIQAAPLSE